MSAGLFFGLVGIAISAIGLHHLLVAREAMRRLLALNVLGTGLFLALIAVAYRGPDLVPDPVPHALVLTGIVVAVSATGLALALARRLAAGPGKPDDD